MTLAVVISSVLLGIGGLVFAGNWMTLWGSIVDHKPRSFIPLLGGIAALAGCAASPTLDWRLGLVAVALDPGGPMMIVFAIASWFKPRASS